MFSAASRDLHPRYVLRGCDSQPKGLTEKSSIGIHWLRGSFPSKFLGDVITTVNAFFGTPTRHDWGRWRYTKSYKWEGIEESSPNIQFYDDQDEEKESMFNGRFVVDIPGGALERLSIDELRSLNAMLSHSQFRCSRVDAFFDDAQKHITPFELGKICALGDFAVFKKMPEHHGDADGGGMQMLTFGKRGNRGSGAYLRVYDKEAESDGEIDAIRWELELSGEKAMQFFEKLEPGLGSRELYETVIRQHIGGCVDFRQRAFGDKNLDRCPQYDWWVAIREMLGKARILIKRIRTTVERSRKWVTTQTIGALQLCYAAFGESFRTQISHVMTQKYKLRRDHYNALDAFMRKFEEVVPICE